MILFNPEAMARQVPPDGLRAITSTTSIAKAEWVW
jgi:hypothetical protein